MRLKKKLDDRFQGFLVPAIPRGPRSVRKWCPQTKNDDGQICAFELLASLAGKLLKESSSSATSNGSEASNSISKDRIKQEGQDGHKPSKTNAIVSVKACNNSKELTSSIRNDVEKQKKAKSRPEFYVKSLAVVNAGCTIGPSFGWNTIPNSPVFSPRNTFKLGSKDDDEKFTLCDKLGSKLNNFKPHSRIADRRIRKFLNSKYWKVALKLRDDGTVRSVADLARKPFYRKKKGCYNRERFYRATLLKRRRFSDHHSAVTFDGGISCDSVSNLPEKNVNVHGGPSVLNHQPSSHVKFSIKSFKVPELLIEVPENATVGSLKKSVMEAVTAILGGELRVGVIHCGKKVKDDSRTLFQTGISCKDNVDMLNFTLEPDRLAARSIRFLEPGTSNCLTRLPENPVVDQEISDDHQHAAPALKCINQDENNRELISTSTDMLTEEASPDCKALVVVPDFLFDALAVIPANQKNKESEPIQRRTRRPFSVSEVESLVKAVEDLGIGRWRDIKLQAFENAEHRTYVDLKDKWKTLVHTARIAPQQRRGELVPQELLNRVLAASAYWSDYQDKHQGKHQGEALKAIEMEAESFVE